MKRQQQYPIYEFGLDLFYGLVN